MLFSIFWHSVQLPKLSVVCATITGVFLFIPTIPFGRIAKRKASASGNTTVSPENQLRIPTTSGCRSFPMMIRKRSAPALSFAIRWIFFT